MTDNRFREKVLAFIRKNDLISPGERVLVAVSGGADSFALLTVLSKCQKDLGYAELAAVHVNHGLRGAQADADERTVQEYCDRQGIPLFSVRKNVREFAKEQKIGVEEAGRVVRYAVFDELCRRHGFHKVATAHTLSDAIETVIFHMARGSGPDGLTGIPPMRQNIIRPLLSCTGEETKKYCRENGIAYVTDSTNDDISFARNRIRKCIVPQLYTINPQADRAMEQLMNMAAEDREYWDDLVERSLADARIADCVYDAGAFRKCHPALRKRLYKHLLNDAGVDPDHSHVLQIDRILLDGGCVSIGKGIGITVKQNYFTVKFPTCANAQTAPVTDGSVYEIGNARYVCRIVDKKNFENLQKIHKLVLQNALDYDKINGRLSIRERQAGDRYTPYRRGGTKSLKKMMIDEKIPQALRSSIPVLMDETGIVLVAGLGCDSRVAIDDTTKRILTVLREDDDHASGR